MAKLIEDNKLYHLVQGKNSVPWTAPALAAIPGFLFGGPIGSAAAAGGTYVLYPYIKDAFDKMKDDS